MGIHAGSTNFSRPSIGSWVSYGLGTVNQNLPSFMVLAPYLPYAGGQVWGSDFLPAVHQGTRIVPGGEPIPNMTRRVQSAALQKMELGLIAEFDRKHLAGRESDPSLAGRVNSIICMGGAVLTMGNASPVASANFFNDPWAAAVVYESGAPLVQIGLDVCQHVSFTESQLTALGRDGGIPARRLAEMSRFIADAYQKTPAPVKRWSQYGAAGRVYFNDVPAMGFAILPEVFSSEHLPVVIETSGVCQGQTVVDFRGQLGREPNARVCLNVDGPRLAGLFLERVRKLGRPA